jgi:hypothetical protein
MLLSDLKNHIDGLKFTVTQEDVERHTNEYNSVEGFQDKSGYSSRANVDSEYVEEHLAKSFPDDLEKITENPLKFFADIRLQSDYKTLIDFKEIAGDFFNPQHDVERYLRAFAEGKLTHFCFYRTNRERADKNIPLVIEANTELTVEFLCISDPHTVFSCKPTKYGSIPIKSIMQMSKHSEYCIL